MSKRSEPSEATPLDLTHLRRETRTALELAVVALAPPSVIDGLAVVAGLLEALGELPVDSPPVVAMMPEVSKRGRSALAVWAAWHKQHLAQIKA